MRICCISDTHSLHGHINLPQADVLVHAGDIIGSNRQLIPQLRRFNDWLLRQQVLGHYKHVVLTFGNHDEFESTLDMARSCVSPEFHLLIDQSVTIDGVKFFASPYSLEFFDWGWQLARTDEAATSQWDKIPLDTDVLITHGPPFGILDQNKDGVYCGDKWLLERIETLKIPLHVCGHIHEGYGTASNDNTTFVNASICDYKYQPVNLPVLIDYDPNTKVSSRVPFPAVPNRR